MADISDLKSKLGDLNRGQIIRIGILIVVLAALAIVITCNMMAGAQYNIQPAHSTFNREAHWVCTNCGHEETANAGQGPQACPSCSEQTFYVGYMQTCPNGHGPFLVLYNYDSKGSINQIKVGDGPWVDPINEEKVTSNKLCPECGEMLLPPGM